MSGDEDDYPSPRRPAVERPETVEELLPQARRIVERPGAGPVYLTTGYGNVEAGDRVLLAVRSLHNDLVVEALVTAFREKGVEVDVITVDIGPDQQRTITMDVDLAITEEPRDVPVYTEFLGRFPWAEELAEERDYDMLIESTAGPFPWTAHMTGEPYYCERIPWQSPEIFVSEAASYPQEILRAITGKLREVIGEYGPGSTVRISDPEGTDLTFTYHEEYFEDPGTRDGTPDAVDGVYEPGELAAQFPFEDNHISGGVRPPLVEKHDASGVIASTLGHHSKPYPRIEVHLEDGKITDIEGGGERGDRMRAIKAETDDVSYPDFPGQGLYWFFEVAIGTNPKVFRPSEFMMKSQPGTLVERLRSGIVHIGTGTSATTYSEDWANERAIPYGHVDHHLNFPTYEIDTGEETKTLIDNGRLTVLDDPDVRAVAAEYGDPDELLSIDWVPPLPGVNTDGDYDEYASDPAAYLE